MLDEIWKDIENYENVYQISNIGRVRRIYKNGNTKILKQDITKRGYCRISLSKNQKHKHYQIHRLVAKAFIPNPNNYPIVNHKDENPMNNNVDNLEWCTYSYNTLYGTAIQRTISTKRNNGSYIISDETRNRLSQSHLGNTSHKGCKHSESTKQRLREINKIYCKEHPEANMKKYYIMCDKDTHNPIREFYTVKDIVEYLQITCSYETCIKNISNCCRGKSHTAYGFYWKGIKI